MWSLSNLDIEIYKNGGRLNWRPFIKATSLGIPLHETSNHHNSLHAAWPTGYLYRLARHSSTYHGYANAKRIFIERLEEYNFCPVIIARLKSLNAFWRTRRDHVAGEPEERHRRTWLVLPSHPLWHQAGIAAVLNDFTSPNGNLWHSLWEVAGQSAPTRAVSMPSLAVSWRNDDKHLYLRLRNA